MKLSVIKMTKAELMRIPKDERLWLIQFMNFFNEISTLRKAFFYSGKEESDFLIRVSQNSQVLFYLKLQAGKLFEYWEYIKKNFQRKR